MEHSFKKSIKKYIGVKFEYFSDFLGYKISIGAYRDRSDRMNMTVEWIVFEKDDKGINYYLALVEQRDRRNDILLKHKITRYKIIDLLIAMNPRFVLE